MKALKILLVVLGCGLIGGVAYADYTVVTTKVRVTSLRVVYDPDGTVRIGEVCAEALDTTDRTRHSACEGEFVVVPDGAAKTALLAIRNNRRNAIISSQGW